MTLDTTTYTYARQHLKAVMDKVCADRGVLAITRGGDADVVMMSKTEYDALQETLHLLRSPANAARLAAAVKSKRGKTYISLDDLISSI